MLRLSLTLAMALLFFFPINSSQAATLKNIDIHTKCTMVVDYNGMKSQAEFPLPAVGESSEIDLTDEKIIHMNCSSYEGEGNEKTFCVVAHGLEITTLKAFNKRDPFGDYPACKAE